MKLSELMKKIPMLSIDSIYIVENHRATRLDCRGSYWTDYDISYNDAELDNMRVLDITATNGLTVYLEK